MTAATSYTRRCQHILIFSSLKNCQVLHLVIFKLDEIVKLLKFPSVNLLRLLSTQPTNFPQLHCFWDLLHKLHLSSAPAKRAAATAPHFHRRLNSVVHNKRRGGTPPTWKRRATSKTSGRRIPLGSETAPPRRTPSPELPPLKSEISRSEFRH